RLLQAEIEWRLKGIEEARAAGEDPSRFLQATIDSSKGPTTEQQFTAINTLLMPLMMKELQLSDTYGPAHPDVASVKRQIRLVRELFSENKDPVKGLAEPNPVTPGQLTASEI